MMGHKVLIVFPNAVRQTDMGWLAGEFSGADVAVHGGRAMKRKSDQQAVGRDSNTLHLVTIPGEELTPDIIAAATQTGKLAVVDAQPSHARLSMTDGSASPDDVVGTSFVRAVPQPPAASAGGGAGAAAGQPAANQQQAPVAVILSQEQWEKYNSSKETV